MNSNDIKLKKIKQRKILQVLILVFGILTILAAGYSLYDRGNYITLGIAVGAFVVEVILTRIRNKIKFKEEDLDSKNQG